MTVALLVVGLVLLLAAVGCLAADGPDSDLACVVCALVGLVGIVLAGSALQALV
jgi:hypothetical protein